MVLDRRQQHLIRRVGGVEEDREVGVALETVAEVCGVPPGALTLAEIGAGDAGVAPLVIDATSDAGTIFDVPSASFTW